MKELINERALQQLYTQLKQQRKKVDTGYEPITSDTFAVMYLQCPPAERELVIL